MSAKAIRIDQTWLLGASSAVAAAGLGAAADPLRHHTFDWRGAPPMPPFVGHHPAAAPDPGSTDEGTLTVSESGWHPPRKCEYSRSLAPRPLGPRDDIIW